MSWSGGPVTAALSSATNPAIAYARQAPALLKQQATVDAVQVTMLKKAMDMQGRAALQLLVAAVTGVGGNINTQA